MKIYKYLNPNYLLIFPFLISVAIFIYSFFWISHGLVTYLLSDKPIISNFFNIVQFTANNKVFMSNLFLILIIIMQILQFIFFIPNIYKSLNVKPIFFILGITIFLYSLSYPFLSNDIFSYYMYAKMAYFYHLNPFNTAPMVLAGKDIFVSIAHNVDSPYNYGPLFLLYSIIPMYILTINKIILYFFTLKILNGILFFISGILLYKMSNFDKRIFGIWFLNPFLLLEWLVNSHNDLIMAAFFIIGYYFLSKKKKIISILFILASILIKYISLIAVPFLFLNMNKKINGLKILGITLPLLIQFTKKGIQPWYLSWGYIFLPLVKLRSISWLLLSFIGFIQLINYYRFLQSGGWGAGYVIQNPMLITNILVVLIVIFEYWDKIKIYFKNTHEH